MEEFATETEPETTLALEETKVSFFTVPLTEGALLLVSFIFEVPPNLEVFKAAEIE